MKIGFFGTPEIAAFFLESLVCKHEIVFIATAIDKPKGRHGTPVPSPAKSAALKYNIPVLQPESLQDTAFLEQLSDFKTDIYVVVAYAKKIPRTIFSAPQLGTINVHPSLLPKYRGAAPMQWALINGESETGVTIQLMDDDLDTGDILGSEKIQLNADMTAGDLYNIVLEKGSLLLNEVLDMLSEGKANPVKQNSDDATYCGKIDKAMSAINWTKSAHEIHNLVRGLNPKPVAWTEFKGRIIKIYKTRPAGDLNMQLKPGYLEKYEKKLLAGTSGNPLEILELQPEGKKIMDGASFLNGYKINPGDFFK